MVWSELCYSGGAWPVVLEAVTRLVVGINYDPTIQHYLGCRIRSVGLAIWTPSPLLRRCVYARSYYPLMKLADLIPWSRVRPRAFAGSDCPLVELADSTPWSRV